MEIKFCFRSYSGQQELKKTTKRDFLLLKIKSLGIKVHGVRKTLEIRSNVNIKKNNGKKNRRFSRNSSLSSSAIIITITI